MKLTLRSLFAVLLALAAAASASAQLWQGKELITPSLVADTESIAPGKPFTVGVVLKIEPGWHTYWQYPGDAGLPVKVEWTLPDGFTAGPIQWPIPHAHIDEPDLLTYVYSDEVLLPIRITPPAQLPAGDVTLTANVSWLVCKQTCIPGHGGVSITLHSGGPSAPANADLFAMWRGELPHEGVPFPVRWNLSNLKEIHAEIEGLPASAKVEFYPIPTAGAMPDHPKISAPDAKGARTVTIPLSDPSPAGAWGGLIVSEQEGKPREGWIVSSAAAPAAKSEPTPPKAVPATPAPSAEPKPTTPEPAASATPTTAPESRTLGGVLALAFLGGLILNFMPCVLPVIALKIFGFVKQSKEDPKRVFRLGLAFVAGVFVFFSGLAAAVVVLKAAGGGLNWGFQFQNPYILAGLIGLVFIFGLNLLGVFEITLSSETTSALSSLSSKSGYGGAFMHGLFTTLLGTSCTAPFLAPSIGFAVTQPAPIVFLLFLTMAAGMSLPYFLLTANPAWMKHLPKPGGWMERFKQLMGFVMLAVVVWLLSVFAQRGAEPAAALFWYLFALAVACWIFGVVSNRIIGALILALTVFGGYFAILYGKLDAPAFASTERGIAIEPDGIPWQPFSEGRLDSAIRSGKPVLIDFTAEWCINCKFFERTVLATDPVKKSLRDHNVTALRADWTNGDPEITKWLKRFNRVGVPLYVLYRPGEEHPVVLDALTQQIILSNLAQIKGSLAQK